MDSGHGGDDLAPVIPLFGGRTARRDTAGGALRGDAGARGDELGHDVDSGGDELHGEADAPSSLLAWHPTWTADGSVAEDEGRVNDDRADSDEDSRRDLAEKALIKRLRTRSFSVAEARGMLREHDLDEASIETVIVSLTGYGYLDDAALAEQLVHVGVDRKGQGRQLIAQTLAKRGVPRDVADSALQALPDDDLERALEYARGKARALRSLDRETALRRLSGQLARRGYSGSLAMNAARTALDESTGEGSGVRFR